MSHNDLSNNENIAMNFAGLLVSNYVETITALIGCNPPEVRLQMLLSLRDARLAEVETLERAIIELGGNVVRTAEIRKWYREHRNEQEKQV